MDKHRFLRGKSRIYSPHPGAREGSDSIQQHASVHPQAYPRVTPDINDRARRNRSAGYEHEECKRPSHHRGQGSETAHACVTEGTVGLYWSRRSTQTPLDALEHKLHLEICPEYIARRSKRLESYLGSRKLPLCKQAVNEENIPTMDPASTLPVSIGDVMSPVSSTT